MDYNNQHKICRVCLEEGAITSIYSNEFAMTPSVMMMICAKVRIHKNDGLPSSICNNCFYRLGIAYSFKDLCENSDIRLRQYLGLMDKAYLFADAETMTDSAITQPPVRKCNKKLFEDDEDSADDNKEDIIFKKIGNKSSRKSRYIRKPPEEKKKPGPKPVINKMPHTCFNCNKTFKTVTMLQTHMRIHTGEKPFTCSYCQKKFTQKYNLHIHLRKHTGEKPLQCEVCSKQFSTLGNFQAHQKIHTGVRDHICPVALCQKSFYAAGDLTKHMVTHTGIKSHECDICGKMFTRNRDMIAHKKKIHLKETTPAISDTDNSMPEVGDHKLPLGYPNTMGATNCHYRCSGSAVEVSAPTPLLPTLGCPSLGINHLAPPPPGIGVGHGMIPHSQGTISLLHSQRLHPY